MHGKEEKKIIVVAGPNGAGKTTFAEEFLPNEARCPIFVNADLIAAGLAPSEPERAAFRAGRLMLEEIDQHARNGRSFAFETTLSGRSYVGRISAWRSAGYAVKLLLFRLASPDLAIERVRQRVREGGHNIPASVIRRRFAAGLRNFEGLYRAVTDAWAIYDTSGGEPQLIDEGGHPARRRRVVPHGTDGQRDADFATVEIALGRSARKAREKANGAGAGVVIWRNGGVVTELPNAKSGQ